eukprot:5534839-Prymnesium_polylepis.1
MRRAVTHLEHWAPARRNAHIKQLLRPSSSHRARRMLEHGARAGARPVRRSKVARACGACATRAQPFPGFAVDHTPAALR